MIRMKPTYWGGVRGVRACRRQPVRPLRLVEDTPRGGEQDEPAPMSTLLSRWTGFRCGSPRQPRSVSQR